MKRKQQFDDQPGDADEPLKCPYLDTIDRQHIDFDAEKLCSVTLSNVNVYVCLVCGKFFHGRGKSTPAFTHSVLASHFVFMNLQNGKAFCLPDGYEILDVSLSDIRKCLSPSFSISELSKLRTDTSLARDVYGMTYLPGFVGLNNLSETDYLNVTLQTLAHITPFRDFWLNHMNYSNNMDPLVQHFGLILRKMWSAGNFKSTVSPQELMQTIVVESKRRFMIGERSEALDLLMWLLSSLHKRLGASQKHIDATSVVYENIQGVVEMTSLTKRLVSSAEEAALTRKNGDVAGEDTWTHSVQEVPFNHLSLDIPPCPLFRDSHGSLVIPQVPLFDVLKKFDGQTWTDQMTKDAHVRKRYRIKRLPRYLILHLTRFTKNNFYVEKNPSIVTFPVRNLELRDYLYASSDVNTGSNTLSTPALQRDAWLAGCPKEEEVAGMGYADLVRAIQQYGSEADKVALDSHMNLRGSVGDEDAATELRLILAGSIERIRLLSSTKYDLVANLCHDSTNVMKEQSVSVGDVNLATSLTRDKLKAKATTVATDVTNANNSNRNTVLSQGSFKVHVQHKATGQWYELEDLRVAETTPAQIGVSESYMLVYEKKISNSSSGSAANSHASMEE